MKKLLLLLFIALVVVAPAYLAQADDIYYQCPKDYNFNSTDGKCHSDSNPNITATATAYKCLPGYTMDPFDHRCYLNTDRNVVVDPVAVTSPGTTPPTTTTPTSPASGSSSTTGPLPECTDNYNSGQICLPKPPYANCTGIACSGSVVDLAAKIINILLYLAGIVAVIFVIIGGYKYMTAGGSEEAATKGRKTMTQAIIGLVIVILAYVIITAVTNFLIK